MRYLALATLALLSAACGGSSPEPKAPAPPATTSAAAPAAKVDATASTTMRRSSVRAVLGAGPGAFLQHVSVDDRPVFRDGKFHGFRVQRLDPAMFQGIDLKVGDVVTRVNGMPIEHPEEALEAFKSLEVSSELRVDYERDGSPRDLRWSIVDDQPPAPKPVPAAPPATPVATPPAAAAPPAKPKS